MKTDLSTCKNPLSQSDNPLPIQSVLRILASQEGCDGSPWNEMIKAADYIDELENKPCEIICRKCGLREQRGEKPSADFQQKMKELFDNIDIDSMLADLRTWWVVAPKWEKSAINVTGKHLKNGLTDTLQRRYDAHKKRFTNNNYEI